MPPTRKRKRGRPSVENAEARQPTPARRKRQRGHQEDSPSPDRVGEEVSQVGGDDEELDAEQFPFPTLKPRVRRVSRQTVSTKWDVLSQTAQEQVRELLNAVERPVLMSYRNDRRREEAQIILGSVLRKLSTKIPRMPFPSQTKDLHFNYEMLLDANRALEASLTPTMHQIHLLRAEIDKEELLLQADETKLSDLTENAKAAENSRKQRARQLHPLLNTARGIETGDDADAIGLVNFGPARAAALDYKPDKALLPLVKQLNGHLRSLGENTGQIKLLGTALTGTKAVVDDALYKCMEMQQYEKTVSC